MRRRMVNLRGCMLENRARQHTHTHMRVQDKLIRAMRQSLVVATRPHVNDATGSDFAALQKSKGTLEGARSQNARKRIEVVQNYSVRRKRKQIQVEKR